MSEENTEDSPGIGHNRVGGIASDRLRQFIERVERIEEEQKASAFDKRQIYAEAKALGFDVKTMRKIVQLRKLDRAQYQEQEALLETYKNALGMLL